MRGSIAARDVGKRFRRPAQRERSFKELFVNGFHPRENQDFWALKGLTLKLEAGASVGVVGKNGAGKSTLLRLFGGVGRPDEGQLQVRGRIGALLDLGAGLTEDLTGRENIYLTGVISGMTRAEVSRQLDRIIDFADLGAFIDSPIRTYSTGMKMRLSFAVAAHIEPDILLIDEALAVGDAEFQRKCISRIQDIKASGCTIVFVSHDADQVRALCDKVLLLEGGRQRAFGATAEVMPLYERAEDIALDGPPENAPDRALGSDLVLRHGVNRWGSLRAEITDVKLLDPRGASRDCITHGGQLAVDVSYRAHHPIAHPIFTVGIHLPDDTRLFESNSLLGGLYPELLEGEGRIRIELGRLDLAPGDYFVNLGIYGQDWTVLDYHAQAYPLRVIGPGGGTTGWSPPVRWAAAEEERGSEPTPSRRQSMP